MSKKKRRKKQDLTPGEALTVAWALPCLMSISATQSLGVREIGSYWIAALLFIAGVGLFVWRRVASGRSPLLGYGSSPRGSTAVSLAGVDAMSGREFEHLVADLCRRDGCSRVRVSGGAGDLGADVVGLLPDGRRFVVQCKRFSVTSKVGSPDMQRFLGTGRHVHGAQVLIFATSSLFTAPARNLGTAQAVVLIDRDRLGSWLAGRSALSFVGAVRR
ncbi:restriction endonuclease [Embleya sp. NBC_00896]|uniref:restriction endonuclease n=1 Tax=Embleya sp. NBC_00896 TaxID=2975961 RepID=UPI002F919AAC|nr:restriction endonuclease [Embleya sp. NBC_00896]